MKTPTNKLIIAAASVAIAMSAHGQNTGPSTASTPYLLPTIPFWQTTSILTVDNTGSTPDDIIAKTGGGTYRMNGIPDGLGAYDNGNGTFTVLMNHEFGNTIGINRDHGNIGAYVSEYIINKNTLSVVSGHDLIQNVYGWDTVNQVSLTTDSSPAFTRFCSADLAGPTAYAYTDVNSGVSYGTSERIFMHGEEGSATGWQQATIATGTNKGNSYTLGKFNLTTNDNNAGSGGSDLVGVGAWENALANPTAQLKTVVVGLNDGGTGIMGNSVALYVGTKLASNTAGATDIDKAGLNNGTLSFVNVAGSTAEIVNANTRATNITSGTAFTLSGTASTTFSRPEDGAWNPLNLSQFYFVTTDRLDQVSDGLGAQVGQTRLWRLNFTDISNPTLGGTIDLLIDGRTVNGQKVNMFDNMTVNETTGRLILQEDVGGAAHNGKIWEYDPITDILTQISKHDPAKFGDRVGGVTTAATSPYTNDEEASGVIDITSLMAGSVLNTGAAGESWYLSVDQAHYGTGITTEQGEGGQLLAIHQVPEPGTVSTLALAAAGLGIFVFNKRRRRA